MNTEEIFKQFLLSKEITIDSRKINKNCIFFGIKGIHFNGNEFAQSAINQGAAMAIVDEKEFEDISSNIFYVKNCIDTLQDVAKSYRNYLNIPIVGLTGSNGKTTTKELIASVLKMNFKVHYTYGNLNNHIGVPLTILSIPKDTEVAVIEMGANHQKEIEILASVVKPDYGYITNFGKAHLEGFNGFDGVIKGKSELYNFLRENNKIAIVNFNDPIQVEKTNEIKRITFSDRINTDYKIKLINNQREHLSVLCNDCEINSNLTGEYNFSNISCAITIGLYFGIDIKLVKQGIENYYPNYNRSQIINKGELKIVMDAYNANPSSMEAALNNFSKFQGSKSVILGDMFELGEDSKSEHQKILDLAEKLDFNKIYLLGKNFSKTTSKNNNVLKFEDKADFELFFMHNNTQKTDNILIKGSRGMKLDLLNIF